MPRRQYVADLKTAQQGLLPPNIHDLQQGEDDGMFDFVFATLNEPQIAVRVTAMIPDVSDYPKSHSYTLFCDDNAPPHICQAIQEAPGINRKSVFELLEMISIALLKVAPDRDGDTEMPDSQADDELLFEEDSDADDVYSSDHEAFGEDDFHQTTIYSHTQATMPPIDRAALQKIRTRIRSDLAAAKQAGFKVGQLGGLLDGQGAFAVVSIRMAKLGISEEAMQAWQIVPTDYLTLLIQYPAGYKSNEELQSQDAHRLKQYISMRVCMSKSYKPTLQDAIKAFTIVDQPDKATTTALPASQDQVGGFGTRETFISRPLAGLLEERLTPILRYRSMGLTWEGAEKFYNDVTAGGASGLDNTPPAKYFQPEAINSSLPEIVNRDQYADKGVKQYSFPLLAMQFMLRHFVRCTEFCLVCHRHLDTDLEAIKPYVCDSPLCLYQYMTLGFGPSIEHEILAQPYVVDLLVSFCYSSAHAQRLREYPDGLALMVPPLDASTSVALVQPAYPQVFNQPEPTPVATPKKVTPPTTYNVRVDLARCEMIFDDASSACPVRKGSWIVLKVKGFAELERHCRISDVNYYPTVNFDEPIPYTLQTTAVMPTPAVVAANAVTTENAKPGNTPNYKSASFQLYDQDFEQLSKLEKCQTICKLLNTLPDVKSMQKFLKKPGSADLKRWVQRISPPALSLLRWIIASNRACIMQVDGNDADDSSAANLHPETSLFTRSEDRVHGMNGYMQFRFAMGAPDKEQRFVDEVRKTTQRLSLNHPTLFAWHGSPLQNWHTIIREGLHFKDTLHGRAYGHGVYHAKDANTSTGYAGMRGNYGVGGGTSGWQNSVLNIHSAFALNEVVNAPSEFVSKNPFYVVAQLDWIQNRYLFVSCQPTADTDLRLEDKNKPVNPHPQDPLATPTGISGQIIIPASAIKPKTKEKRKLSIISSPVKRAKTNSSKSKPLATEFHDSDDSDCASVATLDEDIAIFREHEDEAVGGSDEFKTDFVPGSLDWTTLPVMPPPTYAISATTKRLMKELKELRKVQDSTPLGSLGWYIDTDKIDNPYQWIVELHSFHLLDKNLPLVKDMKKKNLKSIILEVRFNKDFPYTPPYIRVVRPRFVGFNQGGGGHIVLGGAMCMELLTNTGWSSVSSMESVLMQVRLAITSDPPAKMDMHTKSDYGVAEAADGYERACRTHGWAVPPGFKEMALFGGNQA